MDAIYVTALGVVAGCFTATSMLPQVIKTIREKKAEQVSAFMLVTLIVGVLLWTVYGVIIADWPIIATNGFSVLVNSVMLFLRWKYKRE